VADAWEIAGTARRRELLTLLALRLYWDGHDLTHTIRPDVAVLLDDITVRGITWSAGPILPIPQGARCRQ
jgi:hypothetical protein